MCLFSRNEAIHTSIYTKDEHNVYVSKDTHTHHYIESLRGWYNYLHIVPRGTDHGRIIALLHIAS
jgi:hypothetical protein